MKGLLFLIVVMTLNLAVIAEVKSYQEGTCGGRCTHSSDCSAQAGSDLCRCTYLTCTYTESKCGGGCMSNDQCYYWSEGDANCVCTWWFECEDISVLKNPGYKPFLKIAAMARARKHEERHP